MCVCICGVVGKSGGTSKPDIHKIDLLCDIVFVFQQIKLAWRSEGGATH